MPRTTKRTVTNGSWLSRSSGVVVTLVIALAATSTPNAQPAGPRDRQIDGTGPASFERSVAQLQKELPPRRREELELALAVIWITNTADLADIDRDGNAAVDASDFRNMKEDALDLLTDIQRGDLVSTIEDRAKNEHDYTATDYFKQLDGLGYDEVVELAGRPGTAPYIDELRRSRAEAWCAHTGGPFEARSTSRARAGVCNRTRDATIIDAAAGKALNAAVEALSARDYSLARAELGKLNLDRLSPYERSKAEQILFNISFGEKNYAEAREHLRNAIDAGGLNSQEVSAALAQIGVVDSLLAGATP